MKITIVEGVECVGVDYMHKQFDRFVEDVFRSSYSCAPCPNWMSDLAECGSPEDSPMPCKGVVLVPIKYLPIAQMRGLRVDP